MSDLLRLERQLRATQSVLALTALTLVGLVTTAGRPDPTIDEVRTRALVVVDEQGRERVVLGAPLPDPSEGHRAQPSTGLLINDADGHERFAVGLVPSGRLVMGFDAPPGTGDDRNRERINIVATEDGGAFVRFLDRQTRLSARMTLTEDDETVLDLVDVRPDSVVVRRLSVGGVEVLRDAR